MFSCLSFLRLESVCSPPTPPTPTFSQTGMCAGMDGCESGDTEGLDNQDGPFFFFLQKKIPTILSVMPEEQLCSDEAGWQLRLLEDKRTSLHFPSHKTPPPPPPHL